MGGDIYTGQKFAIDAIAAGKEGAISLHRAVHEGQTLTYGRDRRIYHALDKTNILVDPNSYDHGARNLPGYNEAKAKTFGDTRITFTEEQGNCPLPGLRSHQGGRVYVHRLRSVHHQVQV